MDEMFTKHVNRVTCKDLLNLFNHRGFCKSVCLKLLADATAPTFSALHKCHTRFAVTRNQIFLYCQYSYPRMNYVSNDLVIFKFFYYYFSLD